jgi:hypothetical protein
MTYDSRSDTEKHIHQVTRRLTQVCSELQKRGENHDKSKLEAPEKETFDLVTENLRNLTYGSPEYQEQLKSMSGALQHHYSANRHHPEWHAGGIGAMTLLDLLELLADWKAATERHADGSLRRSLELNRTRFGMTDQLYALLERTCIELGWLD